MSDLNSVLQRIERGDRTAAAELLPLVYSELRKLAAARMANEQPDHTLQPTALVHEAYLRLIQSTGGDTWRSREHFFCAAAEAMRRILIDSARTRRSQRRGGDGRTVELPEVVDTSTWSPDLLMDVDDALSALQVEDPAAAAFVKLRVYAGLNTVAAGELLGMSRASAYRTWDFARSWIAVRLANDSK